MLKELKPGFMMMVVMTVLTGLIYPAVITGIAQVALSRSGQRQPDRVERTGDRLPSHRPELHQARVLSAAAIFGRQRLRSDRQRGIEPGADEREVHQRDDQEGRQEATRSVDFDGIKARIVHYCLDNDIRLRIVDASRHVQGRPGQSRRREADQRVQRRESAVGLHAEDADPGRCRDGFRVRARSRTSVRPTPSCRRPGSRRPAACPLSRCRRWSAQHTEGRVARLPRRAARERPGAQSGAGPAVSARMSDRGSVAIMSMLDRRYNRSSGRRR